MTNEKTRKNVGGNIKERSRQRCARVAKAWGSNLYCTEEKLGPEGQQKKATRRS